MANIKIAGQLESIATDGIVVDSSRVYDSNEAKSVKEVIASLAKEFPKYAVSTYVGQTHFVLDKTGLVKIERSEDDIESPLWSIKLATTDTDVFKKQVLKDSPAYILLTPGDYVIDSGTSSKITVRYGNDWEVEMGDVTKAGSNIFTGKNTFRDSVSLSAAPTYVNGTNTYLSDQSNATIEDYFQKKLKADTGIVIANDGTIAATGKATVDPSSISSLSVEHTPSSESGMEGKTVKDALDEVGEKLKNTTGFDSEGVKNAFYKLEEILRKVIFVDDEESAIDNYKELVDAISDGGSSSSVATPFITITSGVMTISCSTSGASIYYTIDGTTPTSSSTQYSSAVTLSDSCTIKAIAMKDGESSSVRTTTWSKPTGQYITFADSNVLADLVARTGNNAIDTDGDGKISYEEAAAYTGAMAMKSNTSITSFNELQYFTACSLAYNAFYNCTSLTSITFPKNVTTTGGGVCYGCTSLTSVTLNDSLTSLVENDFYGCTALTSIEFPSTLTTIGKNAFQGATSLATIDLPESVTTIGEDAFFNTGLTKFVIRYTGGVIALASTSTIYNSSTKTQPEIYVPDALYDSYISATNWATYYSRGKMHKLSEM